MKGPFKVKTDTSKHA